jgi:hypothetical protein
MNTTNILAVADAIEQHTIPNVGFNMAYYFANAAAGEAIDRSGHDCGTTACIFGHALVLMAEGDIHVAQYGPMWRPDIQKWLGLTDEQTAFVCYAQNHPGLRDQTLAFHEIEPAQAVRTLRRLAASGTVDWTA